MGSGPIPNRFERPVQYDHFLLAVLLEISRAIFRQQADTLARFIIVTHAPYARPIDTGRL
jgi:hypothetical protein